MNPVAARIPGILEATIEAIKDAQEVHGEPVNKNEIFVELCKNSSNKIKNILLLNQALMSLYSTDKVLANRDATKFSVLPKD